MDLSHLELGRGIGSKTSLASDETDDTIYLTRPKEVISKSGTSGKPVNLVTNYFEVSQLPDFSFTQYRVDFEPSLDIAKIRNAFIAQQKEHFGGYIYDGDSALYLSKELPESVLDIECVSRENQKYKMTVKKTANKISLMSKMGVILLNLMLRKAMNAMDLQFIRRNLYDMKSTVSLKDFKLDLIPGYISSIRKHEENILLCCEVIHKVIRTETAYDVLRTCLKEETNAKEKFKRQIIGAVVLTAYNNKTYRVDDVDFSKNASSKFQFKDMEKSFMQYYAERYNITISDQNQPLLISNPKARDIRAGHSEAICLIPELCCLTGLTDAMKNNFHLMRAMSDHTRMDPTQRVNRLMKFNKRILNTSKAAETFKEFQTKLEPNLVELKGRQLNQETLLFGNGKTFQNESRVDWTNAMKMNTMFQNVPLIRWGIIYPDRARDDTLAFLKLLIDVAKGMKYDMKEPKMIELPNDRVGSYTAQVESFVSKDPKFIMIVLPNASADRYSAVKKLTCVNSSVPTQVVVQKTMQPKKGNIGAVKSIATKLLIQMNCKLGGAPWHVNIPIGGLMTIGFDVAHDTSNKSKSFGAFVASMDLKKCAKYFSAVGAHIRGEEISGNIAIYVKKALNAYLETHGCLPQRILFYRDGVGEGDISQVHQQEVSAVLEAIRNTYKSAGIQEIPPFGFIIASKRINTRFFASKSSELVNPNAGTVVDSVVTLPERYDFYLISQSVRQGTVTPTSYNVIYDSIGLTPDKVQMLTYKMCHLYYNWSGTTRVPNVLQYAQKLGILVGCYLHQAPSEQLSKQLYFL